MNEKVWYAEGLPFSCTGCGKCCTGSPGYVWIDEEEIEEMAAFLRIPRALFMRKYVRRVGSRHSLVEKKPHYDCIFLKENQCEVYGARPTQCRTFPFWPQNLSSKKAWEETAKQCEGIHKEAELIPLKTIETTQLVQIRRHEKNQ